MSPIIGTLVLVGIIIACNAWILINIERDKNKAISRTLRAAANFCAALPEAKGKDLAEGLNRQADALEKL